MNGSSQEHEKTGASGAAVPEDSAAAAHHRSMADDMARDDTAIHAALGQSDTFIRFAESYRRWWQRGLDLGFVSESCIVVECLEPAATDGSTGDGTGPDGSTGENDDGGWFPDAEVGLAPDWGSGAVVASE